MTQNSFNETDGGVDSEEPSLPPSYTEQELLEPTPSGSDIVRLALVGEGALVVLSVPWLVFENHTLTDLNVLQAVVGALLALPFVALSFGLSYLLERNEELRQTLFAKRLLEFQDSFVKPLCRALSTKQALLIALLSGVGEELFFRGLLTWSFGLIFPALVVLLVVNLLFAGVHFVGKLAYFAPLTPLYFFAGLYFSVIAGFFPFLSQNFTIVTAIAAHATFNFISICLNRQLAS